MSSRSCEIRHGMQKNTLGTVTPFDSTATTSLVKLEQKEESEATQDFSTPNVFAILTLPSHLYIEHAYTLSS